MGSGYVLNFSNRTFEEFFRDNFGIDIYSEKYAFGSGSKANRMRAFWEREDNYIVGKTLGLLFDEWKEFAGPNDPEEAPEECRPVVERLRKASPIPDIRDLEIAISDKSFEKLAVAVRESIEKNQPEIGLDRLHTYCVRYLRSICDRRLIPVGPEKPLHSLLGEYLKALRDEGRLESEMTERILKSAISVFEAFNRVRNEQSFAHDNKVLNYDESLLIFGHIAASIRFIESIEAAGPTTDNLSSNEDEDLPF